MSKRVILAFKMTAGRPSCIWPIQFSVHRWPHWDICSFQITSSSYENFPRKLISVYRLQTRVKKAIHTLDGFRTLEPISEKVNDDRLKRTRGQYLFFSFLLLLIISSIASTPYSVRRYAHLGGESKLQGRLLGDYLENHWSHWKGLIVTSSVTDLSIYNTSSTQFPSCWCISLFKTIICPLLWWLLCNHHGNHKDTPQVTPAYIPIFVVENSEVFQQGWTEYQGSAEQIH